MFEMETAPVGKQVIVLAASIPDVRAHEKKIVHGQFMGIQDETGRWISVGGWNSIGFLMQLVPVRWGMTLSCPDDEAMNDLKKITVDDFTPEFYWL